MLKPFWMFCALVLAVAAPAAAGDFGAGAPEQRYFSVNVAVAAAAVEGYVHNLGDFTAAQVQLEVEMRDAGGAVLGRQLVHVNATVPARSRAFVRVPVAPGTASVRASVLSYDCVPRCGG